MYYMKKMETYRVSCKMYTENSSDEKTTENRSMFLSNCAVCGKKILTFIENKKLSNDQFKMNKIMNKCFLTGDNLCQNCI